MYLNDTTDFFFSCYEANSDQVFHCLGYFFVSSLLTQGEPSSQDHSHLNTNYQVLCVPFKFLRRSGTENCL